MQDAIDALVDACYEDDLALVKKYATIANVNGVHSGYYCTALQTAEVAGHLQIVQYLVEKGAHVKFDDLIATMVKNKLQIFSYLLPHLPNINEVGDLNDMTLLMESILKNRPEYASVLIKHGASVDYENDDGDTALSLAIQYGMLDTIEELHFVNVKWQKKSVLGAVKKLFDQKNFTVLKTLLQKYAFEIYPANWISVMPPWTPSDHLNHQYEILEMVMDITPISLEQVLISAMQSNNYHVAQRMINLGANGYEFGETEKLPIFECLQSMPDLFPQLVKSDQLEVEYEEHTLLMIAIKSGTEKQTKYLLSLGADVNAVTSRIGDSALRCCLEFSPLFLDMLFDHGMKLQEVPYQSEKIPPLFFACAIEHLHVMDSLVAKGANPYEIANQMTLLQYACSCNATNGVIHLLENYKFDVNAQTATFQVAPLHTACSNNNGPLIRELLKHGANPKLVTKNGFTPLHILTSPDLTIYQLLIENGATVNAVANDGFTVLDQALINYLSEVANLYISHGESIYNGSYSIFEDCTKQAAEFVLKHEVLYYYEDDNLNEYYAAQILTDKPNRFPPKRCLYVNVDHLRACIMDMYQLHPMCTIDYRHDDYHYFLLSGETFECESAELYIRIREPTPFYLSQKRLHGDVKIFTWQRNKR